jgi:ATP-binding cassette subfamily B protein
MTAEGFREMGRLFAYLRPYRRKFLAAQVCLVISTIAGLAFPFFTGRLIDGASRGLGGLPPLANLPGPRLDINTVALLMLLALAIQSISSYFQTYWLTEVGERSLADLRRDTYSHLIRLPMAFFSRSRVGELGSRLAADLSLIQGSMTGSIPLLLGQVVVLTGALTLITLTSVRLTLVMLSTLPVAIILAIVFGRWTRKVSRETQDKLADTGVIVEETLQGITNVKAFANERYETARYQAGVDDLIAVVVRAARFQGAFGALISFALFGSTVPTMWYGARLVESGDLTFGGMTQFLLYTTYIGGSMGQFARLYGSWNRAMGATQRVRELLAEVPEDLGEGSSQPDEPSTDGALLARLEGDVVYEEVTFSYPSRPEVTALNGVSLSVEAGQRVALVGPSGAGKSTIVALLLRFYDPDSGRIRIDGRDARDYPLGHLRGQMAIVPQDVLLFGGTIAENIAYGRPGASPAEVEEAARLANAHEFISGFPEAYQTVVGDRGVKLSGGQRQRVAIARAILKDPAILILDEATSSLDSESESLVQQALDRLMKGRTSLIIAHRLATIRPADRIFVVKEGRIVEDGTHEELLDRPDGVYRTLSELQFDLGERSPADLP